MPPSPTVVRGEAVHPSLGPVIRVVPAQLASAVARVLAGLLLVVGGGAVLLDPHPVLVGIVQPASLLGMLFGLALVAGSVGGLRPSAGLVIADAGLHDRAGRSGPILWRDVDRITGRARRRRSDRGSDLELLVEYDRGDGKPRTHVIKATSTYNAELSLIEEINEAWQAWSRVAAEADGDAVGWTRKGTLVLNGPDR